MWDIKLEFLKATIHNSKLKQNGRVTKTEFSKAAEIVGHDPGALNGQPKASRSATGSLKDQRRRWPRWSTPASRAMQAAGTRRAPAACIDRGPVRVARSVRRTGHRGKGEVSGEPTRQRHRLPMPM